VPLTLKIVGTSTLPRSRGRPAVEGVLLENLSLLQAERILGPETVVVIPL